MKIYLWWDDEIYGNFEPYASSLNTVPEDECYIASLLTDDGGLGYQATIRESAEVLDALAKISDGRIQSYFWSRETFVADISAQEVKISSQFCDDFFDVMTFDEFSEVLKVWYDMLVTDKASTSSKLILEINPVMRRAAS